MRTDQEEPGNDGTENYKNKLVENWMKREFKIEVSKDYKINWKEGRRLFNEK